MFIRWRNSQEFNGIWHTVLGSVDNCINTYSALSTKLPSPPNYSWKNSFLWHKYIVCQPENLRSSIHNILLMAIPPKIIVQLKSGFFDTPFTKNCQKKHCVKCAQNSDFYRYNCQKNPVSTVQWKPLDRETDRREIRLIGTHFLE